MLRQHFANDKSCLGDIMTISKQKMANGYVSFILMGEKGGEYVGNSIPKVRPRHSKHLRKARVKISRGSARKKTADA